MSLRQDGTATVTRAASRLCTAKPRRSSEATASSGGDVGAAEAGDALEAQRRGALPGGRARRLRSPRPARRRTVPGSSRVAASTASGISAGSMPRSKRWRASETIWWRRPVSATRIGSNSAHSMKTEVVASSQPVASPPITPAIDCTPAASAIAQSSGVDGVVLAVQRAERLAAAGAQRQHVAGQLRHVEHVQRAAEIDGEEVGDVDQRVDRPQADRGQPVLQPLRARPVPQVADGAAEDPGAGLGPVDLPARAAAERRRDRRRLPRLQRADAGGGEIARDAAHARSSRRGSA